VGKCSGGKPGRNRYCNNFRELLSPILRCPHKPCHKHMKINVDFTFQS
jgi:hypothetical protein